MTKIERYIRLLEIIANNSNMNIKMSCIIVSGGKILSQGYNYNNRMYANKKVVAGIHAECSALMKYKIRKQRTPNSYCCKIW